MKKLLLIIAIFISFDICAKEKSISDNVDTFFTSCKDYKNTNDYFSAGYCIGYVSAISKEHWINRFIFKNISPKCYYTIGEALDRFLILYQRNQFEIGSNLSIAIKESINSLCPFINEEQYDKEFNNSQQTKE